MNIRKPSIWAVAAGAVAALSSAACGDSGFKANAPTAALQRRPDGSFDDHSLCDWRNRKDRESSEVAGPGAIQPNVRRVYAVIGVGEDRHKVLVCREIDTNFDGIKDVVRFYNDKGETVSEEADTNYDGRIDTWITFVKGRLSEVKLDTNFDGRPDKWEHYSNGKLVRVVRDTNFDGKPDVWEIYRDGRLERMGVDVDGDEHVDRWDHDAELRKKLDEAERKKEEEEAAKNAKKTEEERAANTKAAEDDEAKNAKPEPKAPKSKRLQKAPKTKPDKSSLDKAKPSTPAQ